MKLCTPAPSFCCVITEGQRVLRMRPPRRSLPKAQMDVALWKKAHPNYVERRDGNIPRVVATLTGFIWDVEVPERFEWTRFVKPTPAVVARYLSTYTQTPQAGPFGRSQYRLKLKRVDWRGYLTCNNWLIKAWVEWPLAVDVNLVTPREIEFICPVL